MYGYPLDHSQFRICGGVDLCLFDLPAGLNRDVYFFVSLRVLNGQDTYAFGAEPVLQRSFDGVGCDLGAKNANDIGCASAQ